MTTAARKAKLDKLIEENTVVVPDLGKVLWVNKLFFYKPTLLDVYGPTLLDVEKNLGLNCAYERTTPEIYNTTELYDEIVQNRLDDVRNALKDNPRGSEKRFYEVYKALFGIKRVTLTQITEIANRIREEEGVKVPTRMSWYFRFQGFSNFYPMYLHYLGAYSSHADKKTGEEVKELVKPESPQVEDVDTKSMYEY